MGHWVAVFQPLRRAAYVAAVLAGSALAAGLTGCANPGPPRPPSLHLPLPPRDLEAERTGNTVELRFTAPRETTDKLPLRTKTIRGSFCRQVDKGPCVTPPGSGGVFALLDAGGRPNIVVWHDVLPGELVGGAHRMLAYRVELFNAVQRSAGLSDPAYTVAGAAPAAVTHLAAHGTRRGIVLTWDPASPSEGAVVLRRENPALEQTPSKPAARSQHGAGAGASMKSPETQEAKQPVVWLAANAQPTSNSPMGRTLDAAAQMDTLYLYSAARQQTLQLGGRTLVLRSELSAPVSFTLRPVYAPAAPTGLLAAAFTNATSPDMKAPFGVDLIWQPVNDPDIAGYNVYRERIGGGETAANPREKLNAAPLLQPGFHDATAQPTQRYRYAVTAVDTHGNESAAVTTILEPTDVQ